MTRAADASSGAQGAAQVTLEHLFTRTARAFGVTPAQMRAPRANATAHDARLAFSRIAILAGAGEMAVAMKLGRSGQWVRTAADEAGARFDADRGFAESYQEIEIECVVETGVSARTLYPLPVDADPRAIAERLIDSPREAMRVGTADLATLGAAFLALDDEITLLRAENAALRTPLFKMDLSNGQITKIEDPRREPIGAAVG